MTTPSNDSKSPVIQPFTMERRVQLQGWAKLQLAPGYVWHPKSIDDIRIILSLARRYNRTVVPRGAGHSYHDGALNTDNIVLNLSQMRRILEWNPERGIIRIEPGVTIDHLWQATIRDGWWPPVVPTTKEATLGGCLAMNVHGKNSWNKGSIGEQVLAIELLLVSGDLLTVTPSTNPDLFYAVIGGLGMIGVITSITLQLYPIHSGKLLTHQWFVRSLSEMFVLFTEQASTADYLEGWIDGSVGGHRLGCGSIIRADFTDESDPTFLIPIAQVIASNRERIPSPTTLGRTMRPFFNSSGIRITNMMFTRLTTLRSRRAQSIPMAQFHFFHDSVFSYLDTLLPCGGQAIQSFVPTKHAHAVFAELLERSQRARLIPFWCSLKMHRADPFLLSYRVDGFSLELDYGVTSHNATRLRALLLELLEPVIMAGGRFYLAKDSVLNSQTYVRSMGMDRIKRFLAVKHAYDPEHILQSDLFRRIFARSST